LPIENPLKIVSVTSSEDDYEYRVKKYSYLNILKYIASQRCALFTFCFPENGLVLPDVAEFTTNELNFFFLSSTPLLFKIDPRVRTLAVRVDTGFNQKPSTRKNIV